MYNLNHPLVRINERLRAIEHAFDILGPAEELKARLVRLEQRVYQSKSVLTFDEACEYIGVSESLLYKLTAAKEVPHYKPRGKMLYFKKEEIDEWLLQNREVTIGAVTQSELTNNTCNNDGRR